MPVRTKKGRKRRPGARLKRPVQLQITANAERQELLRRLRQEYTPEVCADTLQINEEFPISDQS